MINIEIVRVAAAKCARKMSWQLIEKSAKNIDQHGPDVISTIIVRYT